MPDPISLEERMKRGKEASRLQDLADQAKAVNGVKMYTPSDFKKKRYGGKRRTHKKLRKGR